MVQRRPLEAVAAGTEPSATAGSLKCENIGASSSPSNTPIRSATKPISAISVPISLRSQI